MAATIGAGDFLVTCHARDYTAILMFDPLPKKEGKTEHDSPKITTKICPFHYVVV
jgi:hypothetical protein